MLMTQDSAFSSVDIGGCWTIRKTENVRTGLDKKAVQLYKMSVHWGGRIAVPSNWNVFYYSVLRRLLLVITLTTAGNGLLSRPHFALQTWSKWEKSTLQHWIGWFDFKDRRLTQSINSTFADSFNSTRLQRQTIDLIDFRVYALHPFECLSRFALPLGLCLRVACQWMGVHCSAYFFFKKAHCILHQPCPSILICLLAAKCALLHAQRSLAF